MNHKHADLTSIVVTFLLIALPAIKTEATIDAYDSSNQYLGELVEINLVFLPDQGVFAAFSSFTGDINQTSVYHTTPDCTGQAYVHPVRTHLLIRNGRGTLLVGDPVPPSQVQIGSRLTSDGVCVTASAPHPLVSVSQVSADSLPFSLPVSMPLRFGSSARQTESVPAVSPFGIGLLILATMFSAVWLIRRQFVRV